jgi:uncharacterized protein YegL
MKMSLTDKVVRMPKTLVVFFLIDASGNMTGSKIEAVNTAIAEMIPSLREVSGENADAQIKVAALEFSSGARWITANGPVEVEQFRWNFINAAGGSDLGAACIALNEKLSSKAFMNESAGYFAPVIFFLSGSEPTDDWQSGLTTLKQNNYFKLAIKVAVAIGNGANKDVLKEFTGSMEAVLEVHNAANLLKFIRFVSYSRPIGGEKLSELLNVALVEDAQSGANSGQDDW